MMKIDKWMNLAATLAVGGVLDMLKAEKAMLRALVSLEARTELTEGKSGPS